MLKQLIKAVMKAFGILMLVTVFIIGLRYIEYVIETTMGNIYLWDIGCLVFCFCILVFFCYTKKEKRHADREG